MKKWTEFFCGIFVISLQKRIDRRIAISKEFSKFGVTPIFIMAKENENGQQGICDTLVEIFEFCVKEDRMKPILIFEDDCRFLHDINEYMPLCLGQLPEDWDMFFLGANIPHPENARPYSLNLFSVNRALALHAVAYSKNAMEKILQMGQPLLPIDLQIANRLQSKLKCFCASPMLATQAPGYSDILKRPVDYFEFLEKRFQSVKTYHKLL